MELTDEQIMAPVWGMHPSNRRALTFTRWKDGIDIDYPTAELRTLAEHFKAIGRAEAIADAARLLSLSRSSAQLMAGEMTAQEWRTVSAILVNRIAAIRAV